MTVYRDIDKSKFIEAVQPMHEAFESKGDAYKSSTKIFRNMPLQKRRRSNEDHK
mgnify:FL=1